ncbi:TPA: lpg1654 family Dot/Icm T4SS effector [Legionella pneumophila]|uniref:Tetratricopeptide repeat protein n=1 Tax=Legionella pneumophila subsp. pneumophila TaxID=91891 RepID=A0A3A6UIQ4_LEGPN|nr:lpg1654 family Dot/Icm T4SS effector [Legionella pneumophila]MCW8391895.1 lpg1654 family Dot/Icm T4SS effector [Legionella pneumophila]MCW8404892.1 lpg1654 family Dot/Icm T4SS effector [Legionella pneumophila]MCW8431472.1 lpg1654 family Dot/Icm T4SS effector [Legionella pneumophila]MCW8440913.1 lpg1654 family Dot/Icm T4SS effector [Legionella pneumophila]MCW8464489.1 lpg1654 family Dot/Icm T4SS effector [Legionella pneumophila]
MMDEVKRIHARQKIASAKELEKRYCIKEAITEYLRAIDLFLQISNKTPEDINAIVNVHYDLATLYFNRRDYLSAGRHYEAAINQLIETPLKDDSYRLLTELYIDLSDACYELMNQSAGDEAMANALKAFGLIQNKTFEEQQIGDPVANFKQFHIFYEKKLSTKSYLNSAKFMNHEYLLGEGQVARQQEQALFEQFENISISEIQQIDRSLENMLSQLSLAAEPPNPNSISGVDRVIFNPIFVNVTPSDSSYRGMAMQVLNLAKSYIQNQKISDAIATYQQAIKILNTIKSPIESDLQIVQELTQHIRYLQNKPSSTKDQFSSWYKEAQAPVIATASEMGFFNYRPQEAFQVSDSFHSPNEMDVEYCDGNLRP